MLYTISPAAQGPWETGTELIEAVKSNLHQVPHSCKDNSAKCNYSRNWHGSKSCQVGYSYCTGHIHRRSDRVLCPRELELERKGMLLCSDYDYMYVVCNRYALSISV